MHAFGWLGSASATPGGSVPIIAQPTQSNGATPVTLIAAVAGTRIYPSDLTFYSSPTMNVPHVISILDGVTIVDQLLLNPGGSERYVSSGAIYTSIGAALQFKIDVPAGSNNNDVLVAGGGTQG